MVVRAATRTRTVRAELGGADGPLSYSIDGAPLATTGPGTFADTTPVEWLLAAAAGCFALSLRAVYVRRGLPVPGLAVDAAGTRARGLPSRLASIELEVDVAGDAPAHDFDAHLVAAKQLCTVTNTLGAGPGLTVRRRD